LYFVTRAFRKHSWRGVTFTFSVSVWIGGTVSAPPRTTREMVDEIHHTRTEAVDLSSDVGRNLRSCTLSGIPDVEQGADLGGESSRWSSPNLRRRGAMKRVRKDETPRKPGARRSIRKTALSPPKLLKAKPNQKKKSFHRRDWRIQPTFGGRAMVSRHLRNAAVSHHSGPRPCPRFQIAARPHLLQLSSRGAPRARASSDASFHHTQQLSLLPLAKQNAPGITDASRARTQA